MSTKPDADPKLTRRQAENARAAIGIGVILHNLEQHALGLKEMSQSQVKASQILASKRLPDMQQIETVDQDAPRSVSEIRAALRAALAADPALLQEAIADMAKTDTPDAPALTLVKCKSPHWAGQSMLTRKTKRACACQ